MLYFGDMKTELKHFVKKVNGWNLFVGIVIGFALGVCFINLLIPNANEVIKMYYWEYKFNHGDRMLPPSMTTPKK